jgi:hypothetical protein
MEALAVNAVIFQIPKITIDYKLLEIHHPFRCNFKFSRMHLLIKYSDREFKQY